MRQLPPSRSSAGYSPNRLKPLSVAPVNDQGQRLTELQVIQRLFANGEQGGYWPADPAYLYEDSAGTIPATLNGVCGLWMDRSKESTARVEKWAGQTPAITESGSTSSYNTATRTMTVSVAGNSSQYPWFRFSLGLSANKIYQVYLKLSGDVSKLASANAINFESGTVITLASIVAKGGIVNQTVLGGSAIMTFCWNSLTGGTGAVTIDEISVKEIPGNHALQATTANKPYLRRTPTSQKYWLDSNTANGALTATFASSLGSACTIATVGAEGVTILENQTITTTYNIAPAYGFNGDILIINRALTAVEKALVNRVFGRGVPTLGPEKINQTGPEFSGIGDWGNSSQIQTAVTHEANQVITTVTSAVSASDTLLQRFALSTDTPMLCKIKANLGNGPRIMIMIRRDWSAGTVYFQRYDATNQPLSTIVFMTAGTDKVCEFGISARTAANAIETTEGRTAAIEYASAKDIL